MSIFDKVEDFLLERKIEQFEKEVQEYFNKKENLNSEQLEERRQKIAEKYEDILDSKSFIIRALNNGEWKCLEFLDDEAKKEAFYDVSVHGIIGLNYGFILFKIHSLFS